MSVVVTPTQLPSIRSNLAPSDPPLVDIWLDTRVNRAAYTAQLLRALNDEITAKDALVLARSGELLPIGIQIDSGSDQIYADLTAGFSGVTQEKSVTRWRSNGVIPIGMASVDPVQDALADEWIGALFRSITDSSFSLGRLGEKRRSCFRYFSKDKEDSSRGIMVMVEKERSGAVYETKGAYHCSREGVQWNESLRKRSVPNASWESLLKVSELANFWQVSLPIHATANGDCGQPILLEGFRQGVYRVWYCPFGVRNKARSVLIDFILTIE